MKGMVASTSPLLFLLVLPSAAGDSSSAEQPATGPVSRACRVQMLHAVHGVDSPSLQDCARAILADHHGRVGSACARSNGNDTRLQDAAVEFCATPRMMGISQKQACRSTADCSLGSYCANPSPPLFSRWDPGVCSSCDEIEPSQMCDEITGNCCSASFEIACGNKYSCNRPCSTDDDCTCGSYCSKNAGAGKCQSCMQSSSTCDSTSGDCCSAAFLDRCPSDPFSCGATLLKDCNSTRWIDGYAVNFSYIHAGDDDSISFTGLAVFDPANNRSAVRIAHASTPRQSWTSETIAAIGELGITFNTISENSRVDCDVLHNSSDSLQLARGKQHQFPISAIYWFVLHRLADATAK